MANPFNELEEKIQKLLVDILGVEPEKVTPEATLEDAGADSLDVVELEMELEDRFHIEVPDKALNVTSTFADLVALVERLRAA